MHLIIKDRQQLYKIFARYKTNEGRQDPQMIVASLANE